MKLNVDGLKVYLSGEAPSGLSKVKTNWSPLKYNFRLADVTSIGLGLFSSIFVGGVKYRLWRTGPDGDMARSQTRAPRA